MVSIWPLVRIWLRTGLALGRALPKPGKPCRTGAQLSLLWVPSGARRCHKSPAAAGRAEGHLCPAGPGASASSRGLAGRDVVCGPLRPLCLLSPQVLRPRIPSTGAGRLRPPRCLAPLPRGALRSPPLPPVTGLCSPRCPSQGEPWSAGVSARGPFCMEAAAVPLCTCLSLAA